VTEIAGKEMVRFAGAGVKAKSCDGAVGQAVSQSAPYFQCGVPWDFQCRLARRSKAGEAARRGPGKKEILRRQKRSSG
jgi:hypothetical protein